MLLAFMQLRIVGLPVDFGVPRLIKSNNMQWRAYQCGRGKHGYGSRPRSRPCSWRQRFPTKCARATVLCGVGWAHTTRGVIDEQSQQQARCALGQRRLGSSQGRSGRHSHHGRINRWRPGPVGAAIGTIVGALGAKAADDKGTGSGESLGEDSTTQADHDDSDGR
jgi:hypothetical protein